ncbi:MULTISPECIES: DUF5590 domain-containing protein [Aerococcus]|uniref:Cell wall elongation regulator TseB-like domain-containing protein n=1 Tax=Aerococcus sanguinicola TaxID=119206 RepID=A0A5N1GIY5_9LACT|nr:MULTISPECIES: DUF5590 domain-containing protein [Aerococcus]KAA9300935.1 hypothetical protein F6I03_06410 [Aerococcus sanguinicola]MDK6369168.1 DUF5590 domain-containing protein [Aerococcus sp. UMB9870]MDK6679772.1 DUF5590 domain-containing protein [Aerococcus sp. UMB8608]MDK6686661.1 DUF5590 domain-containing protein [Aerococcus sp. UMB8623]MDK6939694.1 DUF5590 domain-containing protein [Aerococcus sp. UMB8487]
MRKKLLYILIAFLTLYILLTNNVYFSSQKPLIDAEDEVSQVAQDHELSAIKDFYLFTKDETWYSVRAENKDGREVYLTYQPDSKTVHKGFVDEMVTEENAIALTHNELPEVEVKEARLGFDDNFFVWEVSFVDKEGNLGYHYINATNGTWYETINNL